MNGFCPLEVRSRDKSLQGVAPKVQYERTQYLKVCPPKKNSTSRHCQAGYSYELDRVGSAGENE